MDNSFQQDQPDPHQQNDRSTKSPIITRIYQWLVTQVGLTDEIQQDAGVYLGGEGRE